MRKKWINIGKKIAILGMVFSLTSPMVYASSTKDKLDDVQQDKKDTEERLEQVEQKIEELEQLKSDAQEYIKAMDAELAIATDNLEDLENQKVQKEAEIKQTEEELVVAKEEVTKPFLQEAELAEKLERLSELNALLNMEERTEEGIALEEGEKQESEEPERPAGRISVIEKLGEKRKEVEQHKKNDILCHGI